MTTDPFSKEAAAEASVRGATFRVGGMAKGSGMIEPMMATMLGFLTTDARVEPGLLQRVLKAAADDTFNAISVDGECSTNDCVFALANGASGVTLAEDDYPVLVSALRRVCEPLAIDIVRGGEGATKLITIRVTGANTNEDARTTARAIANSPLVKTAVHGGDPNWGRLVAVAGRATHAGLDRATIRIGPVELFSNGAPFDERAPEAAEYLRGKEIELHVDLGTGGPGESRMWSCDLTADYVRQRGLSDIDPGIENPSGRPEHRWFAAMALWTTDHRTPDYRSTDSRITGLPTTGLPDYGLPENVNENSSSAKGRPGAGATRFLSIGDFRSRSSKRASSWRWS